MARYTMTFTRHFVTQLDCVLNFYAEHHVGGKAYCSALLDIIRMDLRRILDEPIRSSYPTNRPRIRYFMSFDLNITFHIQQGRITVLNITY